MQKTKKKLNLNFDIDVIRRTVILTLETQGTEEFIPINNKEPVLIQS